MAPNRQNISLRGLRTFCVAAENESFRDTAEILFITASAVSHQIKNLEEQLGKKLFERSSRQLTLTRDGELLYYDVQPLIRNLDDVALQHSTQSSRSSIRISVQPFFASELFVPRLVDLRRQHPELEITVDTSDESTEKHPGNADVSIRVFSSPPANLACDKLFQLKFVPAGSPALYDRIKVRGKKIVSKFPIIVHDSRPRAWQQWAKASGYRLPYPVYVVRMDSMIAVARAAEQGLGAALVPVPLSGRWFSSGSLVHLFEEELVTRDTYYFASNEAIRDRKNVRILRDWVLRNFANGS